MEIRNQKRQKIPIPKVIILKVIILLVKMRIRRQKGKSTGRKESRKPVRSLWIKMKRSINFI